MTDNKQLARKFFEATGSGNRALFEKICSGDFKGTQNNGPAMTADQLAAYSKHVLTRVQNFRYENIICSSTESGFVEEHDVCCDFSDGGELRLRVCIVADVEDGKIISVREYADSRAAKKLIEAIS